MAKRGKKRLRRLQKIIQRRAANNKWCLLMTDSDNTKEMAIAYYDGIIFRKDKK